MLEFLEDVTNYIFSWVCTKDGKYVPYSIESVRNIFRTVFASEHFKSGENALDAIKGWINDGTIIINPIKDEAGKILEKHGVSLYKAHMENRKKFCEKYHYEEN